jgi:hypothetical protein
MVVFMRSTIIALGVAMTAGGLRAGGEPACITEGARSIPIAYQVDVVVVGGSTGAVAAAQAAAREGARVFLAAPYPYLGEDMTAHLRLWIEEGDEPLPPLAQEIFSAREAPSRDGRPPARPLHVKKTLDEALLASKVEFLYSTYATDVLRDGAGAPCGIVMANRAGRQAVIAKKIIDATDRAWVARRAGARAKPFPPGPLDVRFVVIGGDARSVDQGTVRTREPAFEEAGKTHRVFEYTLRIPFKDGSFASWAEAEQRVRDCTFHPDQQFTSDALFHIPPDPIEGRAAAGDGAWGGVDALPLGAFTPAGIEHLFVLGGCADIPRDHAEKLLRPPALIAMGSRIGRAAAREARDRPAFEGVCLKDPLAARQAGGDVREVLTGVRPVDKQPTVRQDERSLPVLAVYDVVVVGGGTSGAPAGIGAARRGAKTLVIEYLHGLGGVGTQGAISKYYWGNRAGFTAEVPGGSSWSIEQKAEWWRTALREAGADIWFGAMGCGVFADGNRVRGAVVATPAARGVVAAHVVIDATGNADIACAAGSPFMTTDGTDLAVQGTGLPPRRLGASYTNTDFTIVDETDLLDAWHVFVYAKYRAGDAFDLGKLLDSRERRRIVGDCTISILDEINERTYPDTIVEAYSDFDSHGYTIHPYFTLDHPPHGTGIRTSIPYRALLPAGLDGILVAGLGMSAERDAIPLIRMQPDLQNQGYAAGVAAALAARQRCATRAIDVRELQRHLVKVGNLSEKVLTQHDSYPFPPERIAAAVEAVKDGYRDAAVILAHREQALPLLRHAYAEATATEHKLVYAHVLAVLGDATGLDTVLAAIEAFPALDKGWRYTGMGQYGPNMSPLDRLIYAAGSTRNRRATAPILEKLRLLTPESEFSHFRAMALALEMLADPAAAAPLAGVLALPGMQGHAVTTIESAIEEAKKWPSLTATEPRNNAIRELMLGRALFRCGDSAERGKRILEIYGKDLRGHLARHARAVLEGPQQ